MRFSISVTSLYHISRYKGVTKRKKLDFFKFLKMQNNAVSLFEIVRSRGVEAPPPTV